MHSVNHFLVQVHEEDPPEKRFNSAVTDFLIYAERYCDENNWFGYIDLICEDGAHVLPHNVGDEELSTRMYSEE